MTLPEPTLFDPMRLEVADLLLREFLAWHQGLSPDRKVTEWFRYRVEQYFKDPERARAGIRWEAG